ncbi:MAG: aldose epimerase family protein [Candidatus Fimimonas sp.]
MITCQPFEILDGQQTFIYTLKDKITAKIATCGATLISLETPDKNGNLVDVLLGMTTARSIVDTPSYMGSVVGRCANRIAFGRMTVEGKIYQLVQNNCAAHLHGGKVGFNKKVFVPRVEGNSLYLSTTSCDGEENYPANLSLTVKYTVEGSTLFIEYFAESDGTTVVNLTNHAYFNLDGQDSGDNSHNVLQIFADKFLPIDENLVPTGEEREVKGTPFDFTSPKPIGKDISADDQQLKVAGGFDHNFCLRGEHAARAYSEKTGITLDCYTDRPGVQFYAGNFLDGEKGKAVYPKRSGFCLETQLYPNAINMPQWQSPLLKKGEKLYTQTKYVFGVK